MTMTRQLSIPVPAGGGHLLNLEQPASFNDHVLGFLAHLDGPAHALRRTGSDHAAHL